MPDGAEKSAMAVQLFGRSGLDLIPILNKGAQAFDESQAAARRFGLVLTTEQMAALTSMDDAVDTLGQSLRGLQTTLAVTFAPWIEAAVKQLTEAIASLRLGFSDLDAMMKGRRPQELIGQEIVKGLIADWKAYEAARGEGEENLGRKMRDRFIQEQHHIEARKRAEEALGRTIVEITKRQVAERPTGPGVQLPTAEGVKGQVIVEQTVKAYQQELILAKHIAEQLLRRKQVEQDLGISAREQVEQERLGAQIVQQSVDDYKNRFDALEHERDLRQAIHEEQQVYYQMDSAFSDKVAVTRRTAIDAINAEEALATAKLADQLKQREINEEQHQQRLEIIRQRGETARIKVAQQFPTFWEQQLTNLENSSAFSFALIVNQWSNALATMAIKGGDLRAVWEATQIAIVQAFINMAVAAAASAAKPLLVNEAAGAGVSAIWGSAATFVMGLWATVTSSITAMFATLVGIMTAVGEAIMGVLTAIASALIDTVFGSAWGVAILAGVVAIGVALGALAAVGVFAEGGVVKGPMLGLVGEAGPEAIIPLDRMPGMLGGDRPIQLAISVDGKKFMRATARHQSSAWRWEGASA
jgi:hypothetical protein